MKNKEMLIIIGVAFVAGIFSIVLSGLLFGSPQKNPIKVPVVTKIDPVFPTVQSDDNYKKVFNDKALNPTQLIEIGGNDNKTPFQSSNN